ncbi:MAG TPA: hypothetical protein VG097_12220 [Gemmata sp.]|nr:hypothetical protein [Gemmata sp.]
MRLACVLSVGLFSAFAVGCFSARSSAPDSFVCQTLRNSVQSPIRDFDEVRFIKFARHQAEKAWSEYQNTTGQCCTDPYHKGFVEGFVDYVQAGGNGEPPYLPPFRYRLTPFRSTEGVSAVEDWYAGFRQGAAIAKGSGLRELSYVPLPGPAVPVDPSSQNIGRLPPTNPNSALEASPWEQPGRTPMQPPIPPNTDSVPIAPQPRPSKPGAANLPALPFMPSGLPQTAVTRPQTSVRPRAAELPPLPSVPSPGVGPQTQSSVPPQALLPPQVAEIRQATDTTPLVAVPKPVLPPPQVVESSAVLSPVSSMGSAGPPSPQIQQISVPVQSSMPEPKLLPPQLSVSPKVQSTVTPTIAISRPVNAPTNSATDPWRSVAPSYPASGAGPN